MRITIQPLFKAGAITFACLLQACGGGPEQGQGAPAGQPAQTSTDPVSVAPRTPAPADATVFIVIPADGSTVSSPVVVQFGIDGLSVAPAGTYKPDTGHHHLLIDTSLPNLSLPVPADENHIHFGLGQTETTTELEPGEHQLLLVLGDGNHVPHEPPVISEEITITVE